MSVLGVVGAFLGVCTMLLGITEKNSVAVNFLSYKAWWYWISHKQYKEVRQVSDMEEIEVTTPARVRIIGLISFMDTPGNHGLILKIIENNLVTKPHAHVQYVHLK